MALMLHLAPASWNNVGPPRWELRRHGVLQGRCSELCGIVSRETFWESQPSLPRIPFLLC